MKKHLLSLIVLLTVVQSVSAQVNDTIYGRSPNYYYMDWYDECEKYYQPYTGSYSDEVCLVGMNSFDAVYYFGRYQHTPKNILVKGLSCMVSIDYMRFCHPPYPFTIVGGPLPEYMFLYRHDTVNDSLILLDSVRWDTVPPKIMKLPINHDTSAGFLYCEAYEVLFKEPFVVRGSFFIGGSANSNTCRYSYTPYFPNKPTMYVGIGLTHDPCGISSIEPFFSYKFNSADPWEYVELVKIGYGPFHAIVVTDSSMLEVESADEEMGTVTGGGIFHDSTTYNIEAMPNVGYKFTHWNDGDVTNPRAVYLTQDTLFTAYFAPRERYEVVAVSNDLARGSVYGGGVYYEEDTATLTARAWGANIFTQWDDGNTANPRQVKVTQDTVFTALFRNPEGIGEVQGAAPSLMKIVPNPTDGKVSVILSVPLTGEVWVTLQDAAGHEVMSTHIPTGQSSVTLSLDHLPSGSYYATLHYPDGTATEKIVLK